MTPLIIAVLFASSYSHVMRHGQEGKCRMVWVGGISYVVACAVTVPIWAFLRHAELNPSRLRLAAAATFPLDTSASAPYPICPNASPTITFSW